MPAVKSNKASTMALCGVFGSLSVVIMLVSGIIPTLSIAMPAIAGLMLIPVVALTAIKYAYMVYAVVVVLSLLLVADREAVLLYIVFFGYYPVLYATLAKVKNKFLSYIIKFGLFNVAAIVDYFVVTYILMIPDELVEGYGKIVLLALLLVANFIFLLYDNLLKNLIDIYFQKFHFNIKKMLFKNR